MDGSEVTVVVLGRKEVGKTTFIEHCLELYKSEVREETSSTISVCGRDIRVKMIRNPQKVTSARVAVVLMDLTDEDALKHLPASLEQSQSLSPMAVSAVVATKADLYRNRKITTEDAVGFCKTWPQAPLPYYETGLDPPDSIMFAFQEILAKPLIDEYVRQKVLTGPELSAFICEAMDWCLDNGSANLLTHLRSLGFPIPSSLFPRHADVISEYLFTEYPPLLVPEFRKNDLSIAPEPASFEDTLDEPEEPLQVVDTRPSISVSDSYLLPWRNLLLTVFLSGFLRFQSLSASSLTHVDLSHNRLSDVPLEVFLLPALKSLDVSRNRISSLPAIERWARGSRLQCLNASHNSLTGGGSPQPQRRADVDDSVPYVGGVWNVDLSHNKYCSFPSWVLRFPNLKILNLTGNPQIRRLPTQLSQMPHLTSLSVDGHSLHNPPSVVSRRGSAELLRYLQLKRQSSQAWNSLRVVVVGPKGSGKSLLVAKIKEDKEVSSGPTKGLEVSEWRHRSSDFFSFKPKLVTVDFWDFSGDPNYHIIYSCFKCSTSLHLVVCDAQHFKRQALLTWLAGIQATSVERIPVVIVITHFDKLPSRELKENFRRKIFQWLHSWEEALHSGSSDTPSTISPSVKNIYGEEISASFNSQPARVSALLDDLDSPAEDLPLLPVVYRVFFVNSMTGDGIGALRKCLVKIASGSLSQEISGFSGFQMIARDIPSTYVQVEMIVRALRGKFRTSRREGEQRPFYTISELFHKKLRKPLSENGIMERDFADALNFLHEHGLVYLHKSRDPPNTLVSVDPQLVGFLLQRMIRAGIVTQEVTSTSCYLPNSHIFMLWGVEPVWSLELEQTSDIVHSQHLLDYLYTLNLCTPLLPGLTLLPSLFPSRLPSPHHPSPSPSLRCRRVYFFSYFPVHLFSQITSRVVAKFLRVFGGSPCPISPGEVAPSTMSIPFEIQPGLYLYVWRNNLFLRDVDGTQLLIKLLEGVDVCPGAVPHEARLDILLDARPNIEAQWLRIVTAEIDYLLEHSYQGLFSPELPRQLVEICIPFTLESEGESETSPVERGGKTGEGGESGSCGAGEREEERDEGEDDVDLDTVAEETEKQSEREGEGERGDRESGGYELVGGTSPQRLNYHPPRRGSEGGVSIVSAGVGRGGEGRRGRGVGGVSVVRSLPLCASSPCGVQQRLLVEQTNTLSSWEILSKHSSTSTRFSIKTEYTFLVPVWECLQSAFKSPTIRVNNRKLLLCELIPDLLFGDIPSELMLRTPDDLTSEVAQQTGLETGRLQNGMKTSIEWNGFGTGDRKPIRHQSLPEWNGMETSRQSENRGRACTVDSVQQNGIGACNFGTRPSTNTSGLNVRLYYTSQDEEELGGAGGAARMLRLKKCLQKAREDMNKLRRLQCPYLVSAIGVHFSPPRVAFESSPLGSLHHYLGEERRELVDIGSDTVHQILLQLLNAMEYFHHEGLNYHTLQSENVLLWSKDPISIKLSESGITHTPRGCELCSFLRAIPSKQRRKMLATRIDYILLGLLIYEISTGMKPYDHVYSLSTVALAVLHRKLTINIEAELNCERRQHQKSRQRTVSCHRMCMQTTMEECIARERIVPSLLKTRLSLCGGTHEWSPMRLTLNPECVLCSEGADLIYWASGSRGLVTGTLDTSTGVLNSNVLQEPPTPESGLFGHRRGKSIPIAVGRATGLTLIEETQQLWVGAENGSRGSVYVFRLPDMRQHHYIHLQDAVLSLAALNKTAVRFGGDQMKYRVLVGLANGTIIQFLGAHQGKICENPLQGPKLVIHLVGHKPCIAIQLTTQGHVWCSSGNGVEVLDAVSLKSIRKLSLVHQGEGKEQPLQRNDVTLLSINWYGLWTVGRRSPIVRLWNQESGNLIASYNIHDVLGNPEDDITAMALQGRGVWLGTRNGFLFFLDATAMQEGREQCHLGLQHCGEGRIKNIVPLNNSKQISSKLEVFCSQEFPDEVSGALMMWQFQPQQDWRPRDQGMRSRSLPLSSTPVST